MGLYKGGLILFIISFHFSLIFFFLEGREGGSMCGTISMCQESKDGKIEVRYSKTRNRYKTVEINKNTL